MTQVNWLESFDIAATNTPDETQAYQSAYAQGVEDAKAAMVGEQRHLSELVVQAISDLQFNYIEAQAELTESFAPLLNAIVDQLLPDFIEHAFRLQIYALLQSTNAQVEARPMQLTVHPNQEMALRQTIEESEIDVAVGSDDALPEHAAWLGFGSHEMHVDLTAARDEIGRILTGINEPQARTARNE